MQTEKRKIDTFIKKHSMDYDDKYIMQDIKTFYSEMEKSLDGKPSTLKMIPSYINVINDFDTCRPIIVLDAGGTNLRVALVSFDTNRKPVVDDLKVYQIPGFENVITCDEFFSQLAAFVEPIIDKSDVIAICFSYPTKPLPNKDGVIVGVGKQLKVKDLVGQKLAERLMGKLKELGHVQEKKFVVINDSIATLLGGMSTYGENFFDSYIGFILGTGTNTCYIEKQENIKIITENSAGMMFINVESGGYGKFKRGTIDVQYDQSFEDHGMFIYEKMVSGRYLGDLILEVIKKAAYEGLFSEVFTNRIKLVDSISSCEIDEFVDFKNENNILSRCCSERADNVVDRNTCYFLIDAIFERAAKYLTVNLAAVLLKTGKGKNPCRPLCITAEGSTFYNSRLIREKLYYYIKKYINDILGIYCRIVKVENVTLIGTAIAGLIS